MAAGVQSVRASSRPDASPRFLNQASAMGSVVVTSQDANGVAWATAPATALTPS